MKQTRGGFVLQSVWLVFSSSTREFASAIFMLALSNLSNGRQLNLIDNAQNVFFIITTKTKHLNVCFSFNPSLGESQNE